MLYPDLFKQLEAVRWNMNDDIPWDRFDAEATYRREQLQTQLRADPPGRPIRGLRLGP